MGPGLRESAALGVEDGVELELAAVIPGAEVTFAVAIPELLAFETIDAGAVRIPVGRLDSSMFVGATTTPPPAVDGVAVAMMIVFVMEELESESELLESALEYSPVLRTVSSWLPPPALEAYISRCRYTTRRLQ